MAYRSSNRHSKNGSRSPLVVALQGVALLITIAIILFIMIDTGMMKSLGSVFGFTPPTKAQIEQAWDGANGKVHAPKTRQPYSYSDIKNKANSLAQNARNKAGNLPAHASKPVAGGTYTSEQNPYNNNWDRALKDLDTIPAKTANPAGYNRLADFGPWANRRGGGTTRDTILQRDLTGVKMNRYNEVASGTLRDPYTGTTIGFKRGKNTSSEVQIDHVVALQDAWASGARNWTQKRRQTYANSGDVLLAVQGRANMIKGAGLDYAGRGQYALDNPLAPDIWMPSNRAYRCAYTAKRVDIKHRWGLSMTYREKTQTHALLEACKLGKAR